MSIFNPKRDKYIIVMYHYIFDERPDRRGMHPRRPTDFERELDFLASRYRIVSPREVLESAQTEGEPSCALTFDDATRDQYEKAVPLLEERELRGAFFVITEVLADRLPFTHQVHWLLSKLTGRDLVDRYHRFLAKQMADAAEISRLIIPTDRHLNPLRRHDDIPTANFKELLPKVPLVWRQAFLRQIFRELNLSEAALTPELFMQEKEIVDLAERGHLIGVHGETHQPFDTLTPEQIERELTGSIKTLAVSLGQPPTLLSYPYGRLPPNREPVLAFAAAAGIEIAVLMDYRSVSATDHPLLIPRFNTNHLRDWLATGRW